jgi:hypothetical protein
MNTPYQKIVKNGEVINPITKSNPYISYGENRRSRRTEAEELKPGKSYLIGQTYFICKKQLIVDVKKSLFRKEEMKTKEIIHLIPKYATSKKRKEKKKPAPKSYDQILLSHGHKVFTIEGKEITALNRKNAIKKFNKMK